jgi:hypothetical protein
VVRAFLAALVVMAFGATQAAAVAPPTLCSPVVVPVSVSPIGQVAGDSVTVSVTFQAESIGCDTETGWIKVDGVQHDVPVQAHFPTYTLELTAQFDPGLHIVEAHMEGSDGQFQGYAVWAFSN